MDLPASTILVVVKMAKGNASAFSPMSHERIQLATRSSAL